MAKTSKADHPPPVLIADTAVTERPTAEQYAAIAMRSSSFARRMGLEPRVAFISYTTFGNPPGVHIEELRGAVKLLDGFKVDFEYEGEMAPDVALNHDVQRRYYPFSRLSGPATILVMPGLQSANLSAKLLDRVSTAPLLRCRPSACTGRLSDTSQPRLIPVKSTMPRCWPN